MIDIDILVCKGYTSVADRFEGNEMGDFLGKELFDALPVSTPALSANSRLPIVRSSP